MYIVHRLQQSTSSGTGSSIGSGTSIGTNSSTGIGIGSGIGIGTGVGAQDVDYCLTTYGLVKFRDRIYVSDHNELKEVILREFHAKPYSSHPGY